MSSRAHSLTHLTVFWPLVVLALMARLLFGGVLSPMALLDDPIKDLTALSILCDDHTPLSDPDGQHHHSNTPQDDSFLLAEALELFLLSGVVCLLARLVATDMARPWMFAPIRGPPTPQRTALCPQGPPA